MRYSLMLLFAFAGSPASAQEASALTTFLDTKEQVERDQSLGSVSSSDRDARLALQKFGHCVAQHAPGESRRIMLMNFTTTDYRTGLRTLGRDAEGACALRAVGLGGRLRSANVLFAGVVAEGLLMADPAPLNARLARRASATVPTFGPTDAVAQCLARSMPDQTASLIASEPASDTEIASARDLMQAAPACAKAVGITRRMDLSVPALRAMVATASYRLIEGAKLPA